MTYELIQTVLREARGAAIRSFLSISTSFWHIINEGQLCLIRISSHPPVAIGTIALSLTFKQETLMFTEEHRLHTSAKV